MPLVGYEFLSYLDIDLLIVFDLSGTRFYEFKITCLFSSRLCEEQRFVQENFFAV